MPIKKSSPESKKQVLTSKNKLKKNSVKQVVVKKVSKTSGQKKAGIIFPPGRIHRLLKHGLYAQRTSKDAAVFIAAVLEYITSEVVEVAGDLTMNDTKVTMTPKHINLGMRSDYELSKLASSMIVSHGGTLSNINEALFPKKKAKKTKENHLS